MTNITWTNDPRRLADLVPWEHNPKRMTKKQADGLRLSIERFGFAVPFLISPDNEIYDGHQRQSLMNAIQEYGANATVDVRVSSRLLTDDERRELVIRLKQNQAGWDFDMLANEWDKDLLIEWGMDFLAEAIDPSSEWGGMPAFENEDVFGAILTLKVHFASQEDIDAFAKLVEQTVNTKTKYIWYPYLPHENLKAYRAVDGES